MASPFRKDQLSPAMVDRYGLDRRSWGTWLVSAVLVIGFVAALAFVTVGIARGNGDTQLLTWEVRSPEHVTVTFAVRRDAGTALECAVRAQDRTHVDVGYAVLTVPPGPASVQQVFELRTIAPAYSTEVLGCAAPGTLRVIGPQFPPGVVAPEQPYAP